MKMLFAVIILGLLAGGCATQNSMVWTGRTEQEFKRDSYECTQQSRTGYGGGGTGSVGIAMILISESKAQSQADELYKMCMEAKGYTLRDKEELQVESRRKTAWGDLGTTGVFLHPDDSKPVIWKLYPGSPAAKQGMKMGDLLTEKDGQKIISGDDFRACSKPKVGEWVEYKVLRGTEELTFKMQAVHIRDLPDM